MAAMVEEGVTWNLSNQGPEMNSFSNAALIVSVPAKWVHGGKSFPSS